MYKHNFISIIINILSMRNSHMRLIILNVNCRYFEMKIPNSRYKKYLLVFQVLGNCYDLHVSLISLFRRNNIFLIRAAGKLHSILDIHHIWC